MPQISTCVYCTDVTYVVVKIEADSHDITEHPHDDKLAIESSGYFLQFGDELMIVIILHRIFKILYIVPFWDGEGLILAM